MDERAIRLAGKVAIVTGAGQGGGRGVALALAAHGARVVLFGRTIAKLQSVASEIAARGGEAAIVSGDVTSQIDRGKCLAHAIERFQGIDILVNTAISPESREGVLLNTEPQFMSELWATGFVAVLEFMRACHPHMKRCGGGSIINFGSANQHIPKGFAVYGGVKAAVQAMSRGAALEWASDNVRVNVVLPLVVSPAWNTFIAAQPQWAEDFLKTVPMGRMGDPELDIGRPCAFLASDDARFITGATLPLDGGFTFIR